jgi:hypothetical protein
MRNVQNTQGILKIPICINDIVKNVIPNRDYGRSNPEY